MKAQALALYRVSTKRQSDEGHSLDAQEERVNEAADFIGADIVKVWRLDTSSKVGKNLGRKDLQEALTFCRKNKQVGYFIIDEVDRFMRSIDEYYWYKVEFRKLGVKLIFASQPELSEDGQFAKLKELFAVYEAESSNAERKRKTQDKMRARVAAGYYPFNNHAGYKKTAAADGLHVPDEPRFSLLQEGSRLIIYKQYTPPQAIKWMNNHGYRTPGGKKLDLDHYMTFIIDTYYCGVININKEGWPKDSKGLHQRMFSKREHELLVLTLSKRNPRLRRKHNPEFPMANILRHEECVGLGGYEKFAGHYHNRGKRPSGSERPRKPVYDCRDCRKRISRDTLHENFSDHLARLRLLPTEEKFKRALLKAWRNQRGSVTERLTVLRANKENLEARIRETAASYAGEKEGFVKQSLRSLLEEQNIQLEEIKDEIAGTNNTELESKEFVSFALDFVANLRDNWWSLTPESRKRGEQILFNGKIYANNAATVHTPELSSIYRLGINKKDLGEVSMSKMVELAGTAPASDGLPWLVVYRRSLFS